MSAANLAWLLRVLLGLVFFASAVTKITTKGRQQVYDSLTPLLSINGLGRKRAILAIVLVSEFGVVAGLTSGVPSIPLWLTVVCLLLSSFTAVVAVAAARGDDVACACFGSLSTKPAGNATIARNTVLSSLALAAIAIETGKSMAWLAITILLLGLLSAQIIVLVELSRRLTNRVNSRTTSPEGSAPPLTGIPLHGLAGFHTGGGSSASTILAFLSASCEGCLRAPTEVGRIVSGQNVEPYAVVDCRGATNAEVVEMRAKLAESHIPSMQTDQGYDLVEALQVKIYPSYALVSPSGLVVGSCVGTGELEGLLPPRVQPAQ